MFVSRVRPDGMPVAWRMCPYLQSFPWYWAPFMNSLSWQAFARWGNCKLYSLFPYLISSKYTVLEIQIEWPYLIKWKGLSAKLKIMVWSVLRIATAFLCNYVIGSSRWFVSATKSSICTFFFCVPSCINSVAH